MSLQLSGVLVDVEQKPWNMNGNSGIAFRAYVRFGGSRDAAEPVKVTAEQFSLLDPGSEVDWPVLVRSNLRESSGRANAVLSYELNPEFDLVQGRVVSAHKSSEPSF